MSNSVDPDETAHWAVSSGSMLFVKVYYYRLWQEKSSYFCKHSVTVIKWAEEVRFLHVRPAKTLTSRKHAYKILTPLNPTFKIVKLGFIGLYIIFLISAQKT